MSDFDIDKSIAALETQIDGRAGISSSNSILPSISIQSKKSSKAGLIKRAIFSIVLTLAIIIGLKPLQLYEIKYDDEKEKCRAKLKLAKAAGVGIGIAALLFLVSSKIPFLA
jgi:hypothetical protein